MNPRFIRDIVHVLSMMCLLGMATAFAAKPESVPSYTPMFSDFNGDNQIDQVTLTSDGLHKQISITLGKSASRSLRFETDVNERGRLYYGDFDNDGDIDLIWSSQSYPRSLVMWEGDGRGNFSMLKHEEEAGQPLKCLFEEDPPSRTIQDCDGQVLACIISSIFCGGSIHAPPRFKCLPSKTLFTLDGRFSFSTRCNSVSCDRGPPLSQS